ncbi:MAG TPA: histidine phosphatase family protein [Bacteroidia bacterium]|jgi:phosphohistidine phosphatase
MKTLYLIRHAKSDWAIANLPDIDRPLNERGYTDAHKMSLVLKAKKVSPDLIISSPAIRAISTALIFSRNLEVDPLAISVVKDLYNTNPKEYLKTIRSVENKHNTVFIFGHNPIITNSVNSMITSFTKEMSTCSIAGIQCDTEKWSAFGTDPIELVYYDFPKNHP